MNTQQASQARTAAFLAYVEPPVLTEKERKIIALNRRLQVLCEFFDEKIAAINAELAALEQQQ